MKVMLRKAVPNLGTVGDVVDVKDGYARNYLLPHGLAAEPTAANLRRIEHETDLCVVGGGLAGLFADFDLMFLPQKFRAERLDRSRFF